MSDSTLLSIDGISFGDYSIRGLTMTLAIIAGDNVLRRSISGNLLDLTATQFRKYSASITCIDQEAPDLNDIWQGTPVVVTCIPELGVVDTTDPTGGTLTLSMMVDSWQTSRDEWGAETGWTINLLEI